MNVRKKSEWVDRKSFEGGARESSQVIGADLRYVISAVYKKSHTDLNEIAILPLLAQRTYYTHIQ